MSLHTEDKILFFTEAPPMRVNGHGCHVVAATIIDHLGAGITLVLTQRFFRKITRESIVNSFDRDFLIHPDLAFIAGRRLCPELSEIASVISATITVWIKRRRLRKMKMTRVFSLLGGSAYHLISSIFVGRILGIPVDIFFVDDLPASARLAKRSLLCWFVEDLQKWALRKADRVYAITPEFAKTLQESGGRPVSWLPLPIPQSPFQLAPAQATDGFYEIVYIGGLNPLYLNALLEVYLAVEEWNKTALETLPLALRIISYSKPAQLIDRLDDTTFLRTSINASNSDMDTIASNAYALLLPYSQDKAVEKMVKTSFASKIGEYYKAGRPIIIYAPEYGSMTQYFTKYNMPLHASQAERLPALFEQIARYDNPKLIAAYAELYSKLHSPEALTRFLKK